MTKAEKIFKKTYKQAISYIKAFGTDSFLRHDDGRAVAFSELETDEYLCTRTFNGIQKQINKEKELLDTDSVLGVIPEGEYKERSFALEMVQETLNSVRERIA